RQSIEQWLWVPAFAGTTNTDVTLAEGLRLPCPAAGHAVAVEIGAVGVEPGFGALRVGIEARHEPPEARRVVEFDQMRDLVRGEIIEHERGRQDQPPGERQYP